MFSGNNFNLLLVTISADRIRVLPSRPMLVARIESRGPETVGISSNTKVSGPRPIPPESCRPEKSGNRTPLVTKLTGQ